MNETLKNLMQNLADASLPKSRGRCLRHIREAFEKTLGKAIGRTLSAKDAGPIYQALGFEKVFEFPSQSKESYKPELGDLAIINYEPHGHICLFCEFQESVALKNGTVNRITKKAWVSDFKQRDMYGGSVRDKNPPFVILRNPTFQDRI